MGWGDRWRVVRAQLEELADVDWKHPSWWAFASSAVVLKMLAERAAGREKPGGHLSLAANSGPLSDTYMGRDAEAPRSTADAIALDDAVGRAREVARPVRRFGCGRHEQGAVRLFDEPDRDRPGLAAHATDGLERDGRTPGCQVVSHRTVAGGVHRAMVARPVSTVLERVSAWCGWPGVRLAAGAACAAGHRRGTTRSALPRRGRGRWCSRWCCRTAAGRPRGEVAAGRDCVG